MANCLELTPLLFCLLQHWAGLITDAEKPAALSSRDGRLLRRPPSPGKLEQVQLIEALLQAFTKSLQQHARDLLVEAQGVASVFPLNMQSSLWQQPSPIHDAGSLSSMPFGYCCVACARRLPFGPTCWPDGVADLFRHAPAQEFSEHRGATTSQAW